MAFNVTCQSVSVKVAHLGGDNVCMSSDLLCFGGGKRTPVLQMICSMNSGV